MKNILTTPLLIATLLMFSMAASAVDSDGDGVDDNIDAFPYDGCASVDTDGDGMPDATAAAGNCIIDGFETGNFLVNPWSGIIYNGVCETNGCRQSYWHITTQYKRSGAYAAEQRETYDSNISLTRVFPTASQLIFYYKNTSTGGASAKFWVDGVQRGTLAANSSFAKFETTLSAGSHTLQWDPDWVKIWSFFYHTGLIIDDIAVTSLIEDLDDDNDGVVDVDDTFPLDPTESADADSDGIGNNADWDDDNDGVPDVVDAEPLNASNTSEIVLPLDGGYKGMRLENNTIH